MGLPGPNPSYVLGTAIVASLLFAALLGLWRVVVRIDRLVSRVGGRLVPRWAAQTIAFVVVLLVVLLGFSQVILRGVFDYASSAAETKNRTAPAGLTAPSSPLRSGGPGSRESWSSLGQEGDVFVSRAPSAAQIEAATGRPALEPIRVYAGLTTGRSLADVRDAVLAEMDRTKAFQRKAIAVFTTTGTGWVNPWSASAFEYAGRGDTAIASMQYSVLPSSVALFSAATEPPDAGRLLFDAVEQRIAAMPAAQRPRLYASGESLGAFGSQAAFSSPEDALARLAGAVWSGTPDFTPLRTRVAAMRSRGSTEVDPVIDNGAHVRFAADTHDLRADQFGRPLGEWTGPRLLYLQNASDLVAWWSPELLFTTPDWLRETRGDDATAQMSWMPFVTFCQVTADLAVAQSVPEGNGHNYGAELVPAWAAVLGVDDVHNDAVVAAIRATG